MIRFVLSMKKIFLILFLFATGDLMAQKLPDVQIVNPSVPNNIKIDGKDLEWNNSFAAENKRTALFYSLTNDDKNLYIVIKSTTTSVINKIMLGGITFMINLEGKKREKDALGLTYPLISRNNGAQRIRQGQNRQVNGPSGFQNTSSQSANKKDSVLLAMQKAQLAAVKEIKVFGFKNITDSLISIYNEYGIKAFASITKDGLYFCEFAIPLSNLTSNSDELTTIAYQLKVNGLSTMMGLQNSTQRNPNGFGAGGNGRNLNPINNNINANQDLMAPVNFWGKYTLIK